LEIFPPLKGLKPLLFGPKIGGSPPKTPLKSSKGGCNSFPNYSFLRASLSQISPLGFGAKKGLFVPKP